LNDAIVATILSSFRSTVDVAPVYGIVQAVGGALVEGKSEPAEGVSIVWIADAAQCRRLPGIDNVGQIKFLV